VPLQPLLNPQELVEFRHPLAAAARTGLDVAGAGRHRQIRDEGVLGFARPVGDEAAVAIARRQFHRVQRFRHRADLIQLDEDGVADSLVDSLLKDLRIRAEDIVAHQLDLAPESDRQIPPALPVVLPHAILQEHDRVLLGPRLPDFDQLVGGDRLLGGFEEHVLPVVPHFTGGRVEADRDIGGRLVAGFGDRFQNQLDSFIVRFQIGSEPPFIAHRGAVSFAFSTCLSVWKVSMPMRIASANDGACVARS
jgi:hypothetical protein